MYLRYIVFECVDGKFGVGCKLLLVGVVYFISVIGGDKFYIIVIQLCGDFDCYLLVGGECFKSFVDSKRQV